MTFHGTRAMVGGSSARVEEWVYMVIALRDGGILTRMGFRVMMLCCTYIHELLRPDPRSVLLLLLEASRSLIIQARIVL